MWPGEIRPHVDGGHHMQVNHNNVYECLQTEMAAPFEQSLTSSTSQAKSDAIYCGRRTHQTWDGTTGRSFPSNISKLHIQTRECYVDNKLCGVL